MGSELEESFTVLDTSGGGLKSAISKKKKMKAEDAAKAKKKLATATKDSQVFDSAWLNHSLSEGKKLKRLRRLETEVAEDLADQFRGQLDSHDKQQALFSLLGHGFVQKHFPHHKYEPTVLDSMDYNKKREVVDQMKRFIEEKVNACLERHYKKFGTDKKLLGEIREIFASNLNDEINRTLKDIGMIEIKQGRRGRTKVVELEDTVPTRVSFIRETLVDILKNAPGCNLLMLDVLRRKAVILPTVFRQHLFEKLYLAEVSQTPEQYSDHISQRLSSNGLDNITQWEGRKKVNASVILAYERSISLKEEFDVYRDQDTEWPLVDDRLVFYTWVLSIAKLCDDNFSPTHIFWLTRAVMYFPPPTATTNPAEMSKHIAFHFNNFSKVAMKSSKRIFSLGQEVYDTLEQEETDLLIHLHAALQEGVQKSVDPTLFSQSIISKSEEESSQVLRRFLRKKQVADQDLEHFADLKIFLRKWISEAFVGSLSHNSGALVWDFLFLHKFSDQMMINVTLMLVHLLKPFLKEARSFKEVQGTLHEGPKCLLVRDIRRVLQHFSKKGTYKDIPGAPPVPSLQITPPSARVDKRSMDRRIEALSIDVLNP